MKLLTNEANFQAAMESINSIHYSRPTVEGIVGVVMYSSTSHSEAATCCALEFVRVFATVEDDTEFPGPVECVSGSQVLELPVLERFKRAVASRSEEDKNKLGCSIIMAVALATLFTANVRSSDISGKRAQDIWDNLKNSTNPTGYFFALAGTSSLTNVRYKKKTTVGAEEMGLSRAFVAMINWSMAMLLSHPKTALDLWKKGTPQVGEILPLFQPQHV